MCICVLQKKNEQTLQVHISLIDTSMVLQLYFKSNTFKMLDKKKQKANSLSLTGKSLFNCPRSNLPQNLEAIFPNNKRTQKLLQTNFPTYCGEKYNTPILIVLLS